jgi:hypothetical protein
MIKKWLSYITPFTVLVIVLAATTIFELADNKMPGEVKGIFNAAEVVIIIPAIVINVVLRLIFKTKIQWIWLIETVIFLIFCFVFIKK